LHALIGDAPPSTAPRASVAAAREDPVIADPDVQPLLADFIESRRTLITEMGRAMQAGQRDEVRRTAHQLAGSFALYGFLWAGDQCRWIERNFSDIAPAHVGELARELGAHLDTVEIRWAGEADTDPAARADWQI
jgi:HPt (histidine-containing phosphotransfer) domain-containing protein